jgi:hypothetical protein
MKKHLAVFEEFSHDKENQRMQELSDASFEEILAVVQEVVKEVREYKLFRWHKDVLLYRIDGYVNNFEEAIAKNLFENYIPEFKKSFLTMKKEEREQIPSLRKLVEIHVRRALSILSGESSHGVGFENAELTDLFPYSYDYFECTKKPPIAKNSDE